MTNDTKKLSVIDGVEQRIKELKEDGTNISNLPLTSRKKIQVAYEQAVWIDANLNDSCVVDPFCGFHFYDDADAMAFKLRWS